MCNKNSSFNFKGGVLEKWRDFEGCCGSFAGSTSSCDPYARETIGGP